MAAVRSVLVAAAALFATATVSIASEVEVRVTPLQKVIGMLDEMRAKGLDEKHAEEVEFANFHQFCASFREEKQKSIAEAEAQIVQLEADIGKAEADAAALASEVEELEGLIARAKTDLGAATEVRDEEKRHYDAQHEDFGESIDALERAVQVLKSREADVPQSLAQVRDADWLPKKARLVTESFLEMDAAAGFDQAQGPPEAAAYESQSGGVVAIMEKLRHKFQDQLLALEKEEMNARANFEMLAQKLNDNIKSDTETVGEKIARKARRLETAAKAKGDLEVVNNAKAMDEKMLADILVAGDSGSKMFEENQVLRMEEVKAIEKAVEILKSPDVSGSAGKYLPTLVQAPPSLAQLRSEPTTGGTARRKKAAAILQSKARELGSQALAMMSLRVAEDPFVKVKKMIKDLIVQLMEQANQEADQNAFCNAELATNKQTRDNKAAKAEELTAAAEKLAADIEMLSEDIAELGDAIAEIAKQQAEAVAQRAEEKATNAQTIEDAKAGQAAVETALKVLREFYDKAAESMFVQEAKAADAASQSDAGGAPALLEAHARARSPYRGMQSDSGGVLGLLEVCLSDFARLETETSEAEDEAQGAHEKFMAESTQSREVKATEKEHKEDSRADSEEGLRSAKKELSLTEKELSKALVYYEKLKTDCLDTGLSYDERVRAREEEIQSLQEALKVLQGEDIA